MLCEVSDVVSKSSALGVEFGNFLLSILARLVDLLQSFHQPFVLSLGLGGRCCLHLHDVAYIGEAHGVLGKLLVDKGNRLGILGV